MSGCVGGVQPRHSTVGQLSAAPGRAVPQMSAVHTTPAVREHEAVRVHQHDFANGLLRAQRTAQIRYFRGEFQVRGGHHVLLSVIPVLMAYPIGQPVNPLPRRSQ
jgi:hypothetical protein